VIVKATPNTGLVANDVFFFGNEIGDTGVSNTSTVAKVAAGDVTGARTHGASLAANIPITNIYDLDKDARASRKNASPSRASSVPLRGILMATVRSSSVSRAIHTLPKWPNPSSRTDSKWPSRRGPAGSGLVDSPPIRLKLLPQEEQQISASKVSSITSNGLWQCG
jgi:hypothetical protein